jgi:hypothetical protein
MKINKSGPLHRLSGLDFSTAEIALQAAALLLVPDKQTQYQEFLNLMPCLFVLKEKGYTFLQLTKLLSGIGFKLQLSTVKKYYSEALPTHLANCQLQTNEHLSLLQNVRKETRGPDMAAISDQMAAIMGKQRTQPASIVKSFSGEPDINVPLQNSKLKAQ